MSQLEQRILADYNAAMKAGDTQLRDTLRLLRAALKSAEIDKRASLTEEEAAGVLLRQAKQRKESIELFAQGGRQDLVQQEEAELRIIESYLPKQLSRQEIEEMARAVIAELGAAGPGAIGKVMGRLMPRVQGKADGKLVNEVVRGLLSQQ
jgi:uncharacterized protein YqeY